jgi:putative addiction module component (TIGR02574 family)
MSVNFDELRKLPVAEKLRLVVDLWDDISATDEPLVLGERQQQEAERRDDELCANPQIAITRDELWRRVGKTDG